MLSYAMRLRRRNSQERVWFFLQPELSGMRVDIFVVHEGSKAIADNPSSASRSKYIEVKLHFIRRLVRMGEVIILARRNRRAACRCPDEGSLEKKTPCYTARR